MNEPASVVALIKNTSDASSGIESNTMRIEKYNIDHKVKFEVKISEGDISNQILVATNKEHGAMKYTLEFKRKPGFFIINYFIPSLIIITLSYCSFWINKEGVPARASLPAIWILSIISMLNNATFDIPSLSYNPWITQYFLGVYLFLSLAAVEYAVLSFSYVHYNATRALINKNIAKLSNYEQKKKKKENFELIKERERLNIISDSLDKISLSSSDEDGTISIIL